MYENIEYILVYSLLSASLIFDLYGKFSRFSEGFDFYSYFMIHESVSFASMWTLHCLSTIC
jgi:hypothetical protein